MIGIWGPRAREALAAVTGDDVSHEAFPFRTAKTIDDRRRAGARAADHVRRRARLRALRAPEWAVQVWDALMRGAARPEPVGYTALDSLRIEKGYRYFGTDMTSSDTPFEAGVGFCVAKGKRPRARPRRPRSGCARSSSAARST